MPATKTMQRAQALLLVLLRFTAQSDAHWFTINGETSRENSLCRRLGFYDQTDYYAFLVTGGLAEYEINKKGGHKELKIYKDAWDQMLNSLPDKAELFELNQKQFDIDNAIKGVKARKDHLFDFQVIRIGQRCDDTYKNIVLQLKNGVITPPTLNSLQKMQRSFTRNSRRMITDTIINNRDVYDDAIKDDKKKSKSTATPSTNTPTPGKSNSHLPTTPSPTTNTHTTSKPNNYMPSTTNDNDPSMPTPSPSKKARITIPSTPQHTINAVSSEKREFDLVEKAIGKDVALIGDEQLDRLIMQAVALKQKRSGDNVVLNYKDFRNGKMKSFVQVPTNTTDASFMKQSTWIDKSFELNGRNDTKFNSAKRTAKHIRRHYALAFQEALKEQGIMTPEKMNAVRVAAMFKAGNISSRSSRRQIMRHLRHHFGKHSFEPEYKVQMLCDGHTRITHGSIEYAYDEGGIKETIDFTTKNIADEAVAQLSRQLKSRGITSPDKIVQLKGQSRERERERGVRC